MSLHHFSDMKDNLKISLERQWKTEQTQKEQIAALAHDLKTPLTVIQGNADLLTETNLDDEQRLYAGYVVESSGQMQSYIQTLIDISRAAVGYQLHIESIDLPAFMQHLFGYMESLCRTKEIRLQMNTVSLPQMLKFDRVLIERAIMNVISNGLDYSRKAERFMWMFRVTTVSWKFQSQTRERGFLKRHYATHRNGSIWAIKAAIQSYTLVWVYILQIRLWNNIMVSLF